MKYLIEIPASPPHPAEIVEVNGFAFHTMAKNTERWRVEYSPVPDPKLILREVEK